MTQKYANSNSTNESPRCQHLFVNGTRCRLLVPNADALFCPLHAKRPDQEHELADLSAILTRDCRDFQTAQGINHSISELYLLLAQNRISSRRAAVLAYIASLLLRTLPAIDADREAGITRSSPASDFPGPEPDPTKKPS